MAIKKNYLKFDGRSKIPSTGFFIDEEYVSHQVHRLLRNYSGKSRQVNPRYVIFNDRHRVITPKEISYSIYFPSRVSNQRRLLQQVVEATFQRKYLEDKGIFVGSYIFNPLLGNADLPDYLNTRFKKYMQASCGAYKITEEADTLPGRNFSRRSGTKAQSKKELAIGLLISGVPKHLTRDKRRFGTFRAELAFELFETHPFRGISNIENVLGRDTVAVHLLDAHGIVEIPVDEGERCKLKIEKAAIYFESVIVRLLDKTLTGA